MRLPAHGATEPRPTDTGPATVVEERIVERELQSPSVGDTPAEADRRYREAERILLDEARLSLEEQPLRV